MSFGIIIRGKNQPTQSKRFKPHYSRSFGKYVHTKKDYLNTMKEMNLVPYEESNVKKKKQEKYEPSQWAIDMTKEAMKSEGPAGGAFYDELKKKKAKIDSVKKQTKMAKKYLKGQDPDALVERR